MTTTTTLNRRRNSVALIAGTVNVLIGLAVLAGYALHNASLVTLIPQSAPMRLTTAVAISSCGAAVILLAVGFFRTTAAAAVLCGAIGLVNLAEVIAGAQLIPDGTPPRGGLLIGCLLTLAATALLLMSGVVRPRSRLAMVGSIGSVLHSVGVVAAISYAVGVSSAFTAGEFSLLATHTSVAIAVLGAALIRFAWRDSVANEMRAPSWLPFLIGAGTLATSFCLYGAITADIASDFAHQVAFEAEGVQQFLQSGLDSRIQPLIRMARRRAAAPDSKKDEWNADAEMILARGGYQALEWIDPAGRVIWTTPPGAGDAAPDGNAGFESRRRAALEAARQNRQLAATRPIDLVTGGKGTIVVVPVFVRDELAGYVAGVFRYQLLFQNLLSSNPSPRYALAVTDGGEPVFAQGSPEHSANVARTMGMSVGGLAWQLRIAPTEALVLQARSPAGGVLLVGGGFLAVLFTILTYLIQRPRSRATFDAAAAVETVRAAPFADASHLPVISYGRDGTALAWNDAAALLFAGAPPNIPAGEMRFRTIQASFLRTGASAGNVEALRLLLDSCAQPAVIFDDEGRFVAANPASARTLGWSEAAWSGRGIGTSPAAPRQALEVQSVLLMQGRWATPAARSAMAAAAGAADPRSATVVQPPPLPSGDGRG